MPIYKGNTKIVKLYKGSTQIVKRYKGTDLIYSASRLPSEFQEVEYLESSGTQYIDTGVIFDTQNNYLEIDFQITNYPTDSNLKWVCGCQEFYATDDNRQPKSIFYQHSSNRLFIRDGSTAAGTLSYIGNPTTNKYSISIEDNNNQIVVKNFNNTILEYNSLFRPVSISTYLFAKNGSDYETSLFSNLKIYKCSIKKQGTLIRNFIPCYRKADNVAGLYDLVNGVFYTNAGTGTFIVGGNV